MIVEPFNPHATPLESEKTTLPILLEVVPALKFMGEGAPAGAAAVRNPSAERPKDTPPPLPNAPLISLPMAFNVIR